MAKNIKHSLKVFLCHASDDKSKVRELYSRLIADGYDAWLNEAKLLPGQEWRVEIPKAVRNADVFIVCVSNNSINKEGYVQKEIAFALDIAEEKPNGTIYIIPARLESCGVPERLSRWQWVDLFQDGGYEKISASLEIRAKNLRSNNIQDVFNQTDGQVDENLNLEQIKTEISEFESHKRLKKKPSENYEQSISYDQTQVDDELIQERHRMKTNNSIGADSTLPGLIFGAIGRIVCLITRRKEPLRWQYNMLVLALVVQLPTLAISKLLNEEEKVKILGFSWIIYLELGLSAVVLAYIGFRYLNQTLRKYVLDEIQSIYDLRDLQQVLAQACSVKNALYFTLVFTIFWSVSLSSVYSSYSQQFIGFSFFCGGVIFGFLMGSALYMFGWLFNFMLHLGTYNYSLNATSPAHTEVVSRLSKIFTTLLYSVSIFISFAVITITNNTEAVLLVVLIGWLPITFYFIAGQTVMNRIITNGKWKILNRIQYQINEINSSDITNKNNIETINRLRDYYDRILITPNSILNLGTALNFINQLALPLVSLLLVNIDKLVKLLGQ